MNSVRRGSAASSTSARWQPSTFETNSQRGAPAVNCAQRLDRHRRPQVRAADADVDDQPERLAGAARDGARRARLRRSSACASRSVSTAARSARRRCRPRGAAAAPRAARRDPRCVDVLAAPHGIDALAQPDGVGELDELGERDLIESLAREVHQQTGRAAREALVRLGSRVEQFADRQRRPAARPASAVRPRPGCADLGVARESCGSSLECARRSRRIAPRLSGG